MCQNHGRQNAEIIERLNQYASALTEHVLQVEGQANEKFFMISNELSKIQKSLMEKNEHQNRNRKIIVKQFDVFEKKIHIMRNCNKLLFSNQQLKINFDTVASLLNVQYADAKSYRSALYAYRINLNSIPILLNKRLPMSLVPRNSLLVIIDSV